MKYTKGRRKETTGRVKENTTITVKMKRKQQKERLRTRSISKEMNKSGDQLPTAQNSSDLEKKTKKICPVYDKYVKAGVQCGYYQRWFYFKCKNTTEKQVLKEYPAEQQYICTQDQHQTFGITLQFQYQKKIEETKELKQKYEHAKKKPKWRWKEFKMNKK